MFDTSPASRNFPGLFRAMNPLQTAWLLGCATMALVGCGGGSDDTTPPPPPSAPVAAPANFAIAVEYGSPQFRWSPTPGATRYELHEDPDGQGPLPEAKVDDYNETSRAGFRYQQDTSQNFVGALANTPTPVSARLNAIYRLRACNAGGCGGFTDATPFDIAKGISYEFPSGRAPLLTSASAYGRYAMVSRDGLTLALRGASLGATTTTLVFARSSTSHPWQQQASLQSGTYFVDQMLLSADGGTLAVRSMKQVWGDLGSRVVADAVYVYQRSAGAWSQQARLDAAGAPAGCPQPCQAEIADHMALSTDGNLLAVSAVIPAAGSGGGASASSAVFTYARTGTTWAPQAALNAEGTFIASLALSGDGSTLAVTDRDLLRTSATPLVLVFSQNGGGAWTQQGRIPATLSIYSPPISGGPEYGAMALSSDGSTLAVNTANVAGQGVCGAAGPGSTETQRIALLSRAGGTWQLQGQAVMPRALPWTPWALASDGNALFLGRAMFTRSGGAWPCP